MADSRWVESSCVDVLLWRICMRVSMPIPESIKYSKEWWYDSIQLWVRGHFLSPYLSWGSFALYALLLDWPSLLWHCSVYVQAILNVGLGQNNLAIYYLLWVCGFYTIYDLFSCVRGRHKITKQCTTWVQASYTWGWSSNIITHTFAISFVYVFNLWNHFIDNVGFLF